MYFEQQRRQANAEVRAESKKEKDKCKLFCAGPRPVEIACQVRTAPQGRPIGRLVASRAKARHGPKARSIFRTGKLKDLTTGIFATKSKNSHDFFHSTRARRGTTQRKQHKFSASENRIFCKRKLRIPTGKCGFPPEPLKGPTDNKGTKPGKAMTNRKWR